ncbi:MAG: hydrogenase maturation protease [Planctomycetota bacterium]|jgi:hydrogenase maturation protease
MEQCRARVGVIGIGNVLMMDEGLGVHAVRALAEDSPGEWVELIDGGTDPWAALSAAKGCRALLLLDAVAGGAAPGSLHRLSLQEVEPGRPGVSLHDVTLVHLLDCERLLGSAFEEVRVLGMEPAAVEPGIGLSEPCRRQLPAFVEMARAEIREVQTRLNAGQGGR